MGVRREDMKQSSRLTMMDTRKSEKEYFAFSCPRDPGADHHCSTTEPILTLNSYAKLFPPLSKASNGVQVAHI